MSSHVLVILKFKCISLLLTELRETDVALDENGLVFRYSGAALMSNRDIDGLKNKNKNKNR